MSIVQSSSLASQFRPYQLPPPNGSFGQEQLYLSPCSDGSVVESAQVPPFWHGIESHGAALPEITHSLPSALSSVPGPQRTLPPPAAQPAGWARAARHPTA